MNTTDNTTTGWVKLYRSILQWEWWDDPKATRLFIYCLIKANPKDRKWRGRTIERGTFITSYSSIKNDTRLTVQEIRTAINHLKSTGEITTETTNELTKITITNYDKYQDTPQAEQQTNQQAEQQAGNKQATSEQQASNNNEEIEESKKNNLSLSPSVMREREIIKNNFENSEEGEGSDTDAPASQQAPTPQPPAPATSYGSTYADTETLYQAYREEITTETMTSDAALRLARGYGKTLTRDQLGEYLDRFQDTRRASGDTHTTNSDYRRHFTNWLRITIQTEIRTQTSNTSRSNGNNIRQQNATDRPRQIADASQFVERL